MDRCIPLRKSVSDPTDCLSSKKSEQSPISILKHCLSLTSLLDTRLELSRAKVKFHTRCIKMNSVRTGIGCKRCHGSCGKPGLHQGSRTGFAYCSLPHDLSCPGGVLNLPGKIAACPENYVLGMEFPDSAVVPMKIKKTRTEAESQESDDSDKSFSTQASGELDFETQNEEVESDFQPPGYIERTSKMDPSLHSFAPAMLNGLGQSGFTEMPSLDSAPFLYQHVNLSNNDLFIEKQPGASTPPSTSLPGITSSTGTGPVTTNPSNTLLNTAGQSVMSNGATGGTDGMHSLMEFIRKQMEDVKLQMGSEFDRMLGERDKKYQTEQAALRQQIHSAGSRVSQPQVESTGAVRHVQFNAQLGSVQDDAERLRSRMQKEQPAKKLPEGLLSMQEIRNTPGLAQTVEESMQSVYEDPTLAAAPNAGHNQTATAAHTRSIGGSRQGASSTQSMPTTSAAWMQQQQKQMLEYQQQWQQQQQ